jgi:hypothetical protein
MSNRISNSNWIELGTMFCNLRENCKRKYIYKSNEIGDKKADYYYNYNHQFILIKWCLIYFIEMDFNCEKIKKINDIELDDIFNKLIDKDIIDVYISKENVKSNLYLKEDIELFKIKIEEYLKPYNEFEKYKELIKMINFLIKNRLDRVIRLNI